MGPCLCVCYKSYSSAFLLSLYCIVIMELNRWKPQNVPIPFSSMIIASRRSGKSHLIKYLFTKYWGKKFDMVVVMSPTMFTGFFEEFVFGNFFFESLNEEFLETIFLKQRQRAEEGKKARQILLILDDCSDSRERYSNILQRIFTTGRHLNVSIIFSSQETVLSSTVARNNSDFILIGKNLGGRGRQNVTENFLMGNIDDDEIPEGMSEKSYMGQLLRKYTADHSFIAISYLNTTNEFKDIVLQYKVLEEVKTVKKLKNKKVDEEIIKELEEPEESEEADE
jgi:hypothetical protein